MHDDGSVALPLAVSCTDAPIDDDMTVRIRRYGNPSGPRLLVSHGNGLAADLYWPYWRLLRDDFDLMLFDLRNHGWNAVGAMDRHTVPTFVRDIEAVGRAVDREYGVRPRAGVFHSVSALAALLSPARGMSYSALVLFDPPLCKPGVGALELQGACSRAAAQSRNRVEWFESEQAFVDLMRSQPAFERAQPGVLGLAAGTTLRRSGRGYALRCPRRYEAGILESLPGFSRLVHLDSMDCAIKVVGADPAVRFCFLPACEPVRAHSVDYEFVPGTTHLAQLERPEECAALTRGFLRRQGFI